MTTLSQGELAEFDEELAVMLGQEFPKEPLVIPHLSHGVVLKRDYGQP